MLRLVFVSGEVWQAIVYSNVLPFAPSRCAVRVIQDQSKVLPPTAQPDLEAGQEPVCGQLSLMVVPLQKVTGTAETTQEFPCQNSSTP